MSVSTASGMPNYTSSGSSNFIPEIWSGKLLVKFYTATVFAAISNTDYEGEIKDVGDKVIIRTTPDVVIKDYKKGMKLDYDRPESPSIEMQISRAKYFAFQCDDIDAHQADIKLMDDWSRDASEQMKIAIDSQLLGVVYADADSHNVGATAGKISSSYNLGTTGAAATITKANVLDYIIDCGTVLDEQNIPETDRWFVIPAWMAGMIKKSDLKDASITGDGTSSLRNGRIGMIDRFTLYSSNNLAPVTDGSDSCYNMIFGHKTAISFASQMTKMETLRAESTFGNLVRGLNVYDFKALKGTAMGVLYGKKGN